MSFRDDTPRDRPRRDDARSNDDPHRTRSDSSGVDHSGKGPRGWRRSDDRICEDVNVALYRDPNIDAGDIEVRVVDCEVILTGTVADKFARRMAEDIAESVFGVTDVQNLLRVKRDGEGAEASSGRAPDREVKRTAEREGGMEASAPPVVRHKKPPSSPETLAD